MLLQVCQIQYKVKPADALEAYCKVEGLDPLYIRSIAENCRQEPKKARRTDLFKRWMEHIRLSRLPNPRY